MSPPLQSIVSVRFHGIRDSQTELQSAVFGVAYSPVPPIFQAPGYEAIFDVAAGRAREGRTSAKLLDGSL